MSFRGNSFRLGVICGANWQHVDGMAFPIKVEPRVLRFARLYVRCTESLLSGIEKGFGQSTEARRGLCGGQHRLADPLSTTIRDPDYAGEEERFVMVGMSSKRCLLVVVHTIRGERVRLISARPATKHEKRNYEENSL